MAKNKDQKTPSTKTKQPAVATAPVKSGKKSK